MDGGGEVYAECHDNSNKGRVQIVMTEYKKVDFWTLSFAFGLSPLHFPKNHSSFLFSHSKSYINFLI